jgi:AraC family transcriptional regulator, regulatory protein of adaptative response / methylated-DNA-[protein]-cysteine methyltransferase
MTLSNRKMYEALLNKDRSFEGIFYAAIKTTGIFCRPTCPARKPKPENVEYYASAKDAILNGYRPCKLCKPLEPSGHTPDFVKKVITKIEENPLNKISDYDLVKMNIEPNKIRRWFKTFHGITFQGYQRMVRINTAYHQLSNGSRVTDAAFDNGFESISGFSDAYKSIIGNSPSGAKYSRVINIHRFGTPLGPMIALASDEGIYLVEFTDRNALETELYDLQ